jgi:hypothetical protein
MKRKTSRRLIRRLGLALAVVAIAAPAAQAAPQVQYPDDLHATVPHVPVLNLKYGDDLIRPYSTESQNAIVTDGLGRPLPPEVIPPTSDVKVVSDSSGFDWTHVGIGFFALGLMLLGGGALIISRQNRRSRLAAA